MGYFDRLPADERARIRRDVDAALERTAAAAVVLAARDGVLTAAPYAAGDRVLVSDGSPGGGGSVGTVESFDGDYVAVRFFPASGSYVARVPAVLVRAPRGDDFVSAFRAGYDPSGFAAAVLAESDIQEETFLTANSGEAVIFVLPDESAVGIYPDGSVRWDDSDGNADDVPDAYALRDRIVTARIYAAAGIVPSDGRSPSPAARAAAAVLVAEIPR